MITDLKAKRDPKDFLAQILSLHTTYKKLQKYGSDSNIALLSFCLYTSFSVFIFWVHQCSA